MLLTGHNRTANRKSFAVVIPQRQTLQADGKIILASIFPEQKLQVISKAQYNTLNTKERVGFRIAKGLGASRNQNKTVR